MPWNCSTIWEHDSDIWHLRSGELFRCRLAQSPANLGKIHSFLPTTSPKPKIRSEFPKLPSKGGGITELPLLWPGTTARIVMLSPGRTTWASAQARAVLEISLSALTATITFSVVRWRVVLSVRRWNGWISADNMGLWRSLWRRRRGRSGEKGGSLLLCGKKWEWELGRATGVKCLGSGDVNWKLMA